MHQNFTYQHAGAVSNVVKTLIQVLYSSRDVVHPFQNGKKLRTETCRMQIQYSSSLILYRLQLAVFSHQTVLLKGLSPEMGIWICDEIDLGLNESHAWFFNVSGIPPL